MISVLMPVYNGEKYLKECIDSVLNQSFQDFEFIIVNDGSKDNTEEIIKSYTDSRIVYISKKHKGISEALNEGIRNAKGEYIARIDADDKMYPDRLKTQYIFMLTHPDVDILGCGFEWGNGKTPTEYFKPSDGYLTKQSFIGGNVIGHSTVMMRKESLLKLPFIYEKIYDGAEDLKLWYTAITHGLKIYNLSVVVNYYRQHEEQVVNNTIVFEKTAWIKKAYYNTDDNDSKLTVIIPFQNENIEVEKTVTSVRSRAGKVKIILIDDCSDDNYNYEEIAKIFGCKYIRNDRNLGVAGSRDKGVFLCNTPYFVLLDAHMRFYHDNWENKIINLLDENSERLITSNTVVIGKNKNGVYNNEDGSSGVDKFGTNAAYVNMKEPGWEYTARWTTKHIGDAEVIPIACVLGAVYASSVSFWHKIGGLTGLVKYGSDEPLMSIKTWLAGGQVLLIRNWGVGHLYRGRSNYSTPLNLVDSNQLYLIHFFSPEDKISEYEESLKKRIGETRFKNAKEEFMQRYNSMLSFKKHFFDNVAKYDMDYFFSINNQTSY